MKDTALTWMDRCLGLFLGAGALLVYVLTLSVGAYPGQSAGLIVQHAGLMPKLAPDHPLWTACVRVLEWVPWQGLALKLNLLSAFCGGLAVWLLYEITAGTIFAATEVDDANRTRARLASRLGGACAALFLAFSIPFWMVANRAHPAALDVLLLLILTRLLCACVWTGRPAFALVLAFLYGAAASEFATLLLFAPLFGLAVPLFLWREDRLSVRLAVGLTGCLALGLLAYPAAAAAFWGSPGYELREFRSYGQALKVLVLGQWNLIARSLPTEGWLVLVILTIMPWFAALLAARGGLNGERDWGLYGLHAVLTGAALCVLLDVPFARRYGWTGSGGLLVTPHLLCASAFGYLSAYWFLSPFEWWADDGTTWKSRIRGSVAALAAGAAFLAAGFACFRNFPKTDARPAAAVRDAAAAILDSLAGRTWVVTDGVYDPHLLIAAHDRGLPLRLLNVWTGENEVYARYAAAMFDDPRWKNLAGVGTLTLAQEWVKSDPEIEKKLAVLTAPDIWIGAGLTPVAHRTVFLGVRKSDDVDTRLLLAEHEAFWRRPLPPPSRTPLSDPVAAMAVRYRAQVSRVSNDLGVLLEDRGEPVRAFGAYAKAREAAADNLSALMNQYAMIEGGFVPPDGGTNAAARIRSDLPAVLKQVGRRLPLWSLSRHCGYVRSPQVFARKGWTWAYSGLPGTVVSGLWKSPEVASAEKPGAVGDFFALACLEQDPARQDEAVLRATLARDPANREAMLGMARLAIRKKDSAQAETWLARAANTGGGRGEILVERGYLYTASGQWSRARILLEELVEVNPDLLRAWMLLAGILLQQGDEGGLARCVRRIQHLDRPDGFYASVVQGDWAVRKGEWEAASRYWREAVRHRPLDAQVLETVLRLDVARGRKDDAEASARKLLRLAPENTFANYTMGSLQFARGDTALAESSFRTSLAARRTPEALNDLAWLLAQKGGLAEAEELAREATRKNERMPEAWDTLGVILLRTGKFPDAEKALQKALALRPDHAPFLLHVLELEQARGNRTAAGELARTLSARRKDLPETDQRRLDGMLRILETGAPK